MTKKLLPALLAIGLLTACSNAPTQKPGYVTVSAGSPVAAKIAVLEQGGGAEVPATTIEAFDAAFRSLEQKCTQQRDSVNGVPGLADMSVAAVQSLRKNGRTTGYLEFVQAMDKSIPLEAKGLIDCAEIAAILTTMLSK